MSGVLSEGEGSAEEGGTGCVIKTYEDFFKFFIMPRGADQKGINVNR